MVPHGPGRVTHLELVARHQRAEAQSDQAVGRAGPEDGRSGEAAPHGQVRAQVPTGRADGQPLPGQRPG